MPDVDISYAFLSTEVKDANVISNMSGTYGSEVSINGKELPYCYNCGEDKEDNCSGIECSRCCTQQRARIDTMDGKENINSKMAYLKYMSMMQSHQKNMELHIMEG